jgi:signal transduction histidine kinase
VLLDWPASMGSEGFRSARGEGAVRRPPITDQPSDGRAGIARQASVPISNGETPERLPASIPPARGPGRSGSRFSLKNWRVSYRLVALIAVPTITAIAFGAVRIGDANSSATSLQRIETLSTLANSATKLAASMEDEENDLAIYVGQNRPTTKYALLYAQGQETTTTNLASQVTAEASGIGSGYPPQLQATVGGVLNMLQTITYLRDQAIDSQAPALAIIQSYTQSISTLLNLDDQIATGTSDPALAGDVRALSSLVRAEDAEAQEKAILGAALAAGGFQAGEYAQLQQASQQEQVELGDFTSAATVAQNQAEQSTVAGQFVDESNQMLQQALVSGQNGGLNVTLPPGSGFNGVPGIQGAWNQTMQFTVDQMRAMAQNLVDQIQARSQALHTQATRAELETGAEVLIVLLVVLIITLVVARSMVRPLRRLRTGALEIAGLRLPETVRRMSETDGEGVPLDVEPINVFSSDEIGEVARAFDQVHREALRLAANEAALRGNVNAMFVNLSRRSQSLVERQIRLIDDLEQGEQDPERLSSLFQMDHLATRMRRNSENLLVLAGHEGPRRWNQPVALVDVLRAALSEIEQYERVTLNVQPGIAVRGQAVSDVVHLTAELIENATTFSAADTPVTIAGHLLSSGGVLLEITDQGVGMSAEEMAHANWRLDNPPVVDVAVSRRMGLFVVARMAARHGIRVRLRPGAAGGLIALVWLPDETIMHESQEQPPGARVDPAMAEPVTGPLVAAGQMADGWQDMGRAAAEREVRSARTPRFAPLRATAEDVSAAPRAALPGPGVTGLTAGGLPMRSVPRLEGDSGSEPPVTRPQPVIGVSAEPPGQDDDGTPPSYETFASNSAVLGAPAMTADSDIDQQADLGADEASLRWEPDSSRSAVVVPSADSIETENRLPIFEAVESDWFRRGRQAVGRPGREPAATGNGWSSPADDGWRAAEVVSAPSSGGVTSAGLPKRVPRANLVPGAAATEVPVATTDSSPSRSAAATRDRFASFQRGVREGRAAAAADAAGQGPGPDDGSS